jgi:hypothetical protein
MGLLVLVPCYLILTQLFKVWITKRSGALWAIVLSIFLLQWSYYRRPELFIDSLLGVDATCGLCGWVDQVKSELKD